jgi:hypothetical protein
VGRSAEELAIAAAWLAAANVRNRHNRRAKTSAIFRFPPQHEAPGRAERLRCVGRRLRLQVPTTTPTVGAALVAALAAGTHEGTRLYDPVAGAHKGRPYDHAPSCYDRPMIVEHFENGVAPLAADELAKFQAGRNG